MLLLVNSIKELGLFYFRILRRARDGSPKCPYLSKPPQPNHKKSVTSQKILQNMRNIHSNGEVMHHH